MSPEVPIMVLILAIPIYFFSKWILNKLRIGNSKNRKYFAVLPTIILSPLVYVAAIIIWIFSMTYYPSKDFDKVEWKSNIEERYKMSEDIIDSDILIGKSKQEVIELLGTEYWADGESHISYYLGFVPSLANIDPDILDIYFENGKVIKVSQHET
jgi:hypothetical protein